MERVSGKNDKLESLKLESFGEVGKNQAKLEKAKRSWKVSSEIVKFRCSWKVLAEVGRFCLKLES